MDSLLEALGDPLRLAVIIELHAIRRGATQSELRERLAVPSTQRGTLSKAMKRLASAGLVTRDADTYMLAHPVATGSLLVSAANLAREVAEARAHQAKEDARQLVKQTLAVVPRPDSLAAGGGVQSPSDQDDR